MSNDIRDIIERLAILEGRITPTTVKSGLNPEQKTVPQLPALFKPKHISVLTSKEDPEHPMHDYMVGASESEESEEDVLEEAAKVDEEKLLDKVKKSFVDYIETVEERLAKKVDRDLGDKPADHDLGDKAKDRDLIAKALELDEDPTEEEPVNTDEVPTAPVVNPTYSVSAPGAVKTYTMEDGRALEIFGEEVSGFEIRHGNRSMPSRFKTLDEAEMACKMYDARHRRTLGNQDYVDEA